jgi:hypothetical protein
MPQATKSPSTHRLRPCETLERLACVRVGFVLDGGSPSPLGEGDFLAAQGEVLTQRMSHPVVGHQDPLQVRMPLERDAEHVVHLAFGVASRPPRRP